MNAQGTERTEKRLCVGLLAHVDAGKTTLSEAMLYRAGVIRTFGRVDHGDTFLDTDAQERSRGITIFSKQAVLPLPGCTLTLLDTPGHVDFSAEMERTLQVLDCAVLIISGTAGIQGHTVTLWRLLRRYQVPVILFFNKMDMETADRDALLAAVRAELDEGCIDFSQPQAQLFEELSLSDEALMESYLTSGTLSDAQIAPLVSHRRVFPCLFGSALRQTGVDALLDALRRFVDEPARGAEFGAHVFKIARDEKGARLTFLKVTGGTLLVKQTLRGEGWEEKADQLRLYSGSKFTLLQQAPAGTVCAVTGLSKTMPGDVLGRETAAQLRKPGILRGVLRQQFPVRSHGVERRSPELLRREDQVLVLRVDVQQACAQFAQLRQLHGYVVDEGAALARRGDHARQGRFGGIVEVVLGEKRFQTASREVEGPLHRAVARCVLHRLPVVLGSEQQAQRAEQNGFSGPGLTRDDVQVGVQLHFELVDERVVFDRQTA